MRRWALLVVLVVLAVVIAVDSRALVFALVMSLYAVKAGVLGRCRRHGTALAAFLAALAVAVPFTWLICPYRCDSGVRGQAIYIGAPLSTLPIPFLSFLWDWMSPRPFWVPRVWLWRVPWELLAAALWFIFWDLFQAFALEWTWI
jgi:hypothetical protein